MSDTEQVQQDDEQVPENDQNKTEKTTEEPNSLENVEHRENIKKEEVETDEAKQKTDTGSGSKPKKTKQKATDKAASDGVGKNEQKVNDGNKEDDNSKSKNETKTGVVKKKTKNKKDTESKENEDSDENTDGKKEGKSEGKDVKRENLKKKENEREGGGKKVESKQTKNLSGEKQSEHVKEENKKNAKESDNKNKQQHKKTDKEQGIKKREKNKEKAPTAQKQKDENDTKTAKEVEKDKQSKEEEPGDTQVSQSSEPKQQQEQPNKDRGLDKEHSKSDKKHQEYIKVELQRLEDSLKREASKIQAPTHKPYTPYLFNSLEPYYNTYTTRFLIQMPEEGFHGFTSRTTAQGLIDPWQDLKMDQELPPITPSRTANYHAELCKEEKVIEERKKRKAVAQKNGSTRLPKIPIIHLDAKDLAMKDLYYSDVPALRNELKTKYSMNAKAKIQQDYVRTQEDFYRMELDKLEEVHPINRRHMTSTYFAYLQNTPGSKKAITECVRKLEPIEG